MRHYQSLLATLSFGTFDERAYLVVEVLFVNSVTIVIVIDAKTDRDNYAVYKENATQPVAGHNALRFLIYNLIKVEERKNQHVKIA